MGLCDCNQGRLPCTCKDDPVGAVIAENIAKHKLLTVSELKKPDPVNHYAAMAADAATVVRITAERDALQLRLNDTDQRNAELIELLRKCVYHVSVCGTQSELDEIEAVLKPTVTNMGDYDFVDASTPGRLNGVQP